ncbi:MAG: hypothetical protein KC476_06635 [Cyanobacteria bacterium HKST-UBA06]|nr:hypothetical protein [Cyanobacteria bacterium HKST-UBA06]
MLPFYRAALAGLAITTAFSVIAWAHQYPAQSVSAYQNACYYSCMASVAKRGVSMDDEKLQTWVNQVCQESCQCQVDRLQTVMDYDGFVTYGRALQNNKAESHPRHQQVMEAMNSCAQEVIRQHPVPAR